MKLSLFSQYLRAFPGSLDHDGRGLATLDPELSRSPGGYPGPQLPRPAEHDSLPRQGLPDSPLHLVRIGALLAASFGLRPPPR